jgi:hypothetical protein
MRIFLKCLPVVFGLLFLLSWAGKSIQQFNHGNLTFGGLAAVMAAVGLGVAFVSAKRLFNRSAKAFS